MTAATAARHAPAELDLVAIVGDVVTLAAASASRPGERNHVAHDLATGEAHCECKGALCGHACWHLDHAERRAIALVAALGEVRYLTDADLARRGRVLSNYVRRYTARAGRPLPADEERLTAARFEWHRRAALGGQDAHPGPLPFPAGEALPAAA